MIISQTLQCVNGCGALLTTEYEQSTVQICQICRGIWLHYEQLNHIIAHTDKTWTTAQREQVLATLGTAGVPLVERTHQRACPQCNEFMPAINYQYASGIIINKCKYQHGVWLDLGELNKIQIYKEHCQTLKLIH